MAKGTPVVKKVTTVGKYGFKVEGSDEWVSLSKFDKNAVGVHAALLAGQNLAYDESAYNGKLYAANLNVVAGSSSPVMATASAVFSKPNDAYPVSSKDKDERITRLSSLSTAFGAPFTAAFTANGAFSDAVEQSEALAERLTRYALTGDFNIKQEELAK